MTNTLLSPLDVLGVSAHPGYADQLEGIATPSEAVAAALELAEHLVRLARLESHPRTNAAQLLEHHAEAGTIAEQLLGFLLTFELPA